MKELKTLKDLKDRVYCKVSWLRARKIKDEFERELRAEAVKWVKHLEQEKIRLKEDVDCVCDCASRIEMFKLFFNLTEEDLLK